MKNSGSNFANWYDAFLKRLQLTGCKLTDDRESLALIHEKFVYNVPFDMLDSYYHQSKNFHIETILKKLLLSNRGGGCSELNELFILALEYLGVEAWRVLSKVASPIENDSPKLHKSIIAKIDNILFLCDVGMGHLGPVYPIQMDGSISQQPGGRFFKVEHEQGTYFLKSLIQNKWSILYKFKNVSFSQKDFIPIYYYNNNYPDSRFVKHRYAALLTQNGYRSLVNNSFIHADFNNRKRKNIDEMDLGSLLKAEFNIIPDYYLYETC